MLNNALQNGNQEKWELVLTMGRRKIKREKRGGVRAEFLFLLWLHGNKTEHSVLLRAQEKRRSRSEGWSRVREGREGEKTHKRRGQRLRH